MIKYIKRKIRELLEGKELRLLREEHKKLREDAFITEWKTIKDIGEMLDEMATERIEKELDKT